MDSFFWSLEKELPAHLTGILRQDYIPIIYVKDRHGDAPYEPLIALLDAYRQVAEELDLETLASQAIPGYEGSCQRCGSCCAHKRPGAVSFATWQKWKERKIPVTWFYSLIADKEIGDNQEEPSYHCWFHNGTRLRLCPFMFVNRLDRQPFCALHHLGDENRPPACSRFQPNPPVCQSASIVLAP